MPGYTHLQVAMPSSFGLWFAAYAESLADDLIVMQAAYRVCNRNPLGSAAGYGSSFPLNRTQPPIASGSKRWITTSCTLKWDEGKPSVS